MSQVLFVSAAGSLIFFKVRIRLESYNNRENISKYMANPGRDYWEAVKWIRHYLKGNTYICCVV